MKSADSGQGCDADSTLTVQSGVGEPNRIPHRSHWHDWVEARNKSRGCVTKADWMRCFDPVSAQAGVFRVSTKDAPG